MKGFFAELDRPKNARRNRAVLDRTRLPRRCHGTGFVMEHGECVACPCATCTQARAAWMAQCSMTLEYEPTPEEPTAGDRKLIGALDWISKGTVVVLALLFIAACVRAVATGAVDRLVR